MTVPGEVKRQRRATVAASMGVERPTGVNFGHWRSLRSRRLHEAINRRGMAERVRALLADFNKSEQEKRYR